MDEQIPFFSVHLMLTAAGWEPRARLKTWVAFAPSDPADHRVIYFQVLDDYVSRDDAQRIIQVLRADDD